jgi:uncharacterized protein YjbI with pentapeptide repeats
VVGYDGGRNVRDEESSVGQKKLVRKAEPPSKRGIAWPRWTGFRGMTVRDWLDLLVVPLALVVISLLFATQQDHRQQQIENQRADAERALAKQRAQDETLQAYLDQMSHLLLEEDLLGSKEGSVVRTLARARTFATMQRLDAERNQTIARFLDESKLIETDGTTTSLLKDASLKHADLAKVDLTGADLSGAKLNGANLELATLNNANLEGADVSSANMKYAYVSHANMHNLFAFKVNLSVSELWDTNLSGPNTYLSGANLSDAYLKSANLSDAHLDSANLRGAMSVTQEQLDSCSSLEGATMPDGQTLKSHFDPNAPTFKEWLKGKEATKSRWWEFWR